MRRREFITLLGGTAVIRPRMASAQKALIRIGFLAAGAATSANTATQIEAITQGLRNNGLIAGQDYVLDARFAAGDYARFPEMAREVGLTDIRTDFYRLEMESERQIEASFPEVGNKERLRDLLRRLSD